jgi:hypothetical protein
MAIYAALAFLGWLTLDGKILWATWIFLGGIALRTWLVVLKNRVD